MIDLSIIENYNRRFRNKETKGILSAFNITNRSMKKLKIFMLITMN